MSQLFEEAALGSLKLKNRMVRSATWEGIAALDGSIADTAYELYKELAEGGVGAIITGFTSVSSTDFYMDDMMRLSRDELIGQYRHLTDLIHAQGIPVITQLALGAYYRPMPDGRYRQTEPDDMTKEEIWRVALETELDEDLFLSHLADGSAEHALQEDLAFASSLGITSLPAYLMEQDGRSVLFQSFRYEDFLRAFRSLCPV